MGLAIIIFAFVFSLTYGLWHFRVKAVEKEYDEKKCKLSEVEQVYYAERPLVSGLSGFLAVVSAFIIFFSVTANLPQEYKKVETKYIYSIVNERDVEGHFVLGCGSVNTEAYYYYFEDGEMGLKMSKIKAESVEIFETDSESTMPAIERYKIVNSKPDWFLGLGEDVPFAKEKLLIVLPKGSVKQRIEISL